MSANRHPHIDVYENKHSNILLNYLKGLMLIFMLTVKYGMLLIDNYMQITYCIHVAISLLQYMDLQNSRTYFIDGPTFLLRASTS